MIYFCGQFDMPTDYHTKGFYAVFAGQHCNVSVRGMPFICQHWQLCATINCKRAECGTGAGSFQCGLWIALQIRINFAAKLRNKSFGGQRIYQLGRCILLNAEIQSEAESRENYEGGGARSKDILLMRFVNWLLNDSRCIIVWLTSPIYWPFGMLYGIA